MMIIKDLNRAGLEEEVRICALKAFQFVESSTNGSYYSWALWSIVWALSETYYIDMAIEAATLMGHNEFDLKLALKLINSASEKGKWRYAEDYVSELFDAYFLSKIPRHYEDDMLKLLIETLVKINHVDIILTSIDSVDVEMRKPVLQTLFDAIAKKYIPEPSLEQKESHNDIPGYFTSTSTSSGSPGQNNRSDTEKTPSSEPIEDPIQVINNIEDLDVEDRRVRLEIIAGRISRISDPTTALRHVHAYWSRLPQRVDLVMMLPAATPLIIAHPPLLQELLDSFDWIDQILKEW